MSTLFCVHNNLCISGAWFVDSWGVGGINKSRARFVRVIMNSEKWCIIYLFRIIDVQKCLRNSIFEFFFSPKLKKEGKSSGALDILKFACAKKSSCKEVLLKLIFSCLQDDNHSNLDLIYYVFKSKIAIIILVANKQNFSKTHLLYVKRYFFSVTPWRKIIVINEMIIFVKVVWVSEHGIANSLVE